ncbi:MAG: amidohydrolase, partial [Saprospiraceae bacterium]
MRIAALALLAALFLAACQPTKTAETATLILLNGQFFTAEKSQPTATAVAVRGDRILYVGDAAGAQKWAGDSTRVLDLQGAFVMPGLIEGHGHFASLGRSLLNINLLDTKSWEEVVNRVAEKAKSAQPGEWLEGRGWHQEKWSSAPEKNVGGYPFHEQLSAVTPQNPVILYHASGHSLFANEQAMQLAGISRETPDPVGGRIVRDAAGRAVGVFEENAMDLVERAYQKFKNQRPEAEKQAFFDKSIALASAECLRKGITSFQDAGSDFWEIDQCRRLAEAGKLDLRLWLMIAQPKKHEFARLADFPKIGLGQNHLTVRAVKCYLDGALGSYGAWLLA